MDCEERCGLCDSFLMSHKAYAFIVTPLSAICELQIQAEYGKREKNNQSDPCGYLALKVCDAKR